MIYVTSAKKLSETLPIINACPHFHTYEHAKQYADRFVGLYAQPCHIYSFVEHETIEPEPKKTFRLEFNRLEADQIDVKAEDLAQAIKIARSSFPKNEWELIRSHLIEKE